MQSRYLLSHGKIDKNKCFIWHNFGRDSRTNPVFGESLNGINRYKYIIPPPLSFNPISYTVIYLAQNSPQAPFISCSTISAWTLFKCLQNVIFAATQCKISIAFGLGLRNKLHVPFLWILHCLISTWPWNSSEFR